MDIQEQIAFEKFHAKECNCDYNELKRRLDHQEKVMGHRYIPSSPRHEAWLVWDAAWQAKVQAVPEWVSVDDKLPAIGVYVMVFLEKQGHNPTTYNFCQYTKFGFHLSNVTHWMPLPDAPKAQEQKG